MGAGASIGFHAAYLQEGGQLATSGVGNALIGAYLAQMGMPERAIVYITEARPNQINWLDAEQASRTGIEVAMLPAPQVQAAPTSFVSPNTPAPSGPVTSQRPMPPPLIVSGTIHRASLNYKSREILLPPGDWTELYRNTWMGGYPGPSFAETEILLARIRNAKLDAVIDIRTSDYMGGIFVRTWGERDICNRSNVYYKDISTNSGPMNDCMQLNYMVRTSSSSSAAWRAYQIIERANPEATPRTFIVASYRFADLMAATTVRYYFGVEAFGFPAVDTSWDASPWHRHNLSPEYRAMLAQAQSWMQSNRATIRNGVVSGRSGQLPDLEARSFPTAAR